MTSEAYVTAALSLGHRSLGAFCGLERARSRYTVSVDGASTDGQIPSSGRRFRSNVWVGALLIDVLRLYMVLSVAPFALVVAHAFGAFALAPDMGTMFWAFFAVLSVTAHAAAFVQLWAMVIGVVWLNRAYANQRALGHEPRYTSPLSVCWWLIPVLNLIRPYQMIQEIWSSSRSEHALGERGLLVWWWGAFVATLLLGGFDAAVLSPNALALLFGVVAAFFGTKVVRWVTLRQELAVPWRAGGALTQVLAAPEATGAVVVAEEAAPSSPYRSDQSRTARVSVGAQTVSTRSDSWTAGEHVIGTDEIRNVSVRRELPWSAVAAQRYALFARTDEGEYPLFRQLLPGEAHAARRILRELVTECRFTN